MEKLIHHLNEQFPILNGLEVVRDHEAGALPPFLGLLLATMESKEAGACCFVFPRKEDVGRLVSVLYALIKLKKSFPIFLSEFVSRLTAGDFVKIPPSPKVFRFLGDDLENGGRITLKCKPRGLSTFAQKSIPKALANRLVKAQSPIITGRLEDCSLRDNPTPLDALLGIQSHGNLSIMPNLILVLDTQGHFDGFTTTTALKRRDAFPVVSIENLKICGHISPTGRHDGQSVEISPGHLIGVTSSIELLIETCSQTPQAKKMILVNDIALLKSPQHFDTISENHNVIIIAEHSELEKVGELRQRNCKIWPLTEREIQIGKQSSGSADANGGFFKGFLKATENIELAPKSVACESATLEAISIELEFLNNAIRGEGKDELKNLVGKLYGMLVSASGVLFTPTISEFVELRAKLAKISDEIPRQSHWLSAEDSVHLSKACVLFAEVFGPSSQLGVGKRDKLREIFKNLQSDGKIKIGALAKREQHFGGIQAVAKLAGVEVSAFTGQAAILPDEFFDAVVCVNWPGSDSFRKFYRRYMAPDIRLLVYPFELRWLNQCRKRLQSESGGASMSKVEKAKLLNLNPALDFNWPESPIASSPPEGADDNEFSIVSFERTLSTTRRGSGILNTDSNETIDATYVEFSGGTFAFMTDGHMLPVATQLVLNPNSGQPKLPEREVSAWKTGDYIVFLSSGETEVVHEIANRIMGEKAIGLRKMARTWKDALVAAQLTTAGLHRSLAEVGCNRTIATVRNWLTKQSQIGTEDKSDIEAIAEVTKFKPLTTNVEQVWNAIEQIRPYHISAGTVLQRILAQKLPSVIHELEESDTEIEIEDQGKFLGRAKIVKVELIDQKSEKCSPSQINRLLFEDSGEGL